MSITIWLALGLVLIVEGLGRCCFHGFGVA